MFTILPLPTSGTTGAEAEAGPGAGVFIVPDNCSVMFSPTNLSCWIGAVFNGCAVELNPVTSMPSPIFD